MSFNFENLQKVQKANNRQGTAKGQNWRLRVKFKTNSKDKVVNRFYLANDVWGEMNLDEMGLIQYNDDENQRVLLCVTDNDNAVLLKKSEKGNKSKNFKSDLLANALASYDVINPDVLDEDQFLDIKDVTEESEGIPSFIEQVFEIVKDTEDRSVPTFGGAKSDSDIPHEAGVNSEMD